MSNEVTTTQNSHVMAALRSLKTNAAKVAARLPENTGKPYLRFTKNGEWVFGSDDNLLPFGTQVILNTLEVQEGFICWPHEDAPERKPLGERLFRVLQGEDPAAHPLDRITDPTVGGVMPWRRQGQIPLKVFSGKYAGNEMNAKQDSNGFMQMYDALIRDISAHVALLADDDMDYVYPICELRGGGYAPKKKSYGKWIHTPTLLIVGWADKNGNIDPGYEDEDDGEDAKPKLTKAAPEPTRRAQAPEPDPEPEDATPEVADEAPPARRRRRA